MTELTISIKTQEARYTQKFLLYVTYTMDPDDPTILDCIQKAQSTLNLEYDSIEDIKVRATLIIK